MCREEDVAKDCARFGMSRLVRDFMGMETDTRRREARAVTAASASAMLVGILVLFGWTAGVETLKRLAPGLVAMNPATAVLFVFAGAALWLKRSRGDGLNANAAEARLAHMLAGLVILGATLKFAEMWFGWSSGIDQWLFAEKLAGAFDTQPNRMAPNTALGFLLIGLALASLGVTTRRGLRPAEVLASLAFVLALLAPVGHIYRVPQFAGWAHYIPMALPTAATFMLLSAGVFMARPDAGMMAVVGSATAGSMMVRRLYPAMILALLVMGWLRLEGERRNFYGKELGVALYTIANIVVLGVLVYATACETCQTSSASSAGSWRAWGCRVTWRASDEDCRPILGYSKHLKLRTEERRARAAA